MADETEEFKVTPMIPKLTGMRLEIDGAPVTVDLRFDMLAQHKIAKEGRALGEDNDLYMTIALIVKHFIWPRNHGLTTEQIMEGISHDQMAYINAKIAELLKLNNVDLPDPKDPTNGLPELKTSPTSSGGSSKLRPDSASDSALPSSGTPPQPS